MEVKPLDKPNSPPSLKALVGLFLIPFSPSAGRFLSGWKVFRVPETATVLMSGGISFGELNEEQVRRVKKMNTRL